MDRSVCIRGDAGTRRDWFCEERTETEGKVLDLPVELWGVTAGMRSQIQVAQMSLFCRLLGEKLGHQKGAEVVQAHDRDASYTLPLGGIPGVSDNLSVFFSCRR